MTNNKNLKLFTASLLSIALMILLYIIFSNSSAYTDNAYLHSNVTVIRPKVNGYIVEVLVKDNQPVKRGQIIAKIDDRDYILKAKQIKEEITASQAKMNTLNQQIIIQGYESDKASYELNGTKATLDKANKDLKRAQVLVKDKAIAVQSYDNSLEIQKVSDNKYQTVQKDLEVSKLKALIIESNLVEEKARLDGLKASLELAELDIEYTKIQAQTNGAISRKSLQVGQLVSPVVSVAYLIQSDIWVEANFKETQIAKMHKGQSAIVTIDSVPGKKFKATVDSFAPATGAIFSILPPENATGNFTKIVQRVPVKLIFDENQDLSELRPGLSSEVTVDLD